MSANVLLLLSSTTIRRPTLIRSNLAAAVQNSNRIWGTLYVQVWKPKSEQANDAETSKNSVNILSRVCSAIYSFATLQFPTVDVRFVVKEQQEQQHDKRARCVSLVLGDSNLKDFEQDIQSYVQTYLTESIQPHVRFLVTSVLKTSDDEEESSMSESSDSRKYDVVALGGTFDRMHNGHKILLTEAVLRCSRELIVGVTDGDMIKNKLLCELIEPCEARMKSVREFLEEISPPLSFRVLPILDPFGPTIHEEQVGLIVVSQETLRGATKINEIRESKGFPPLKVHSIDLVAESQKQSSLEEDKVSSSSRRLRLLGTRLRPPLKPPSLPYIVGLTGGIASGKSTICEYLNTLQVATINCDQLGHEAYKPGTECHGQIVATFGSDILAEDKTQINRKALGAKVFGKPEELKRLTDIVWPEIRRLAQIQIQEFVNEGHKLIVLDAAVLIEAQWDDMCNDIWVAFVPKEEAVRRIQQRDNLPGDAAENRINSQLSNQQRIAKANFVFCSLWEKEFTRSQVDKALKDVRDLINNLNSSL